MKNFILTVFILVMCSGCLTKECFERVSDQRQTTSTVTLTTNMTGNITKNGKTIFIRNKNTQYTLKSSNKNHYKISDSSDLIHKCRSKKTIPQKNSEVNTPLSVYGLRSEPSINDDSYINLKTNNATELIFDMKLPNVPLRQITVPYSTNTPDPFYVKRAGILIVLTPVALALDVAAIGSVAALALLSSIH